MFPLLEVMSVYKEKMHAWLSTDYCPNGNLIPRRK